MAKISKLALIPPILFAAIAGLFLGGMFHDNETLPSLQEGRPAPDIVELPVGDMPSFGPEVLGAPGAKVVNFWASWCAPCRVEHPNIMAISKQVPVYGVNRDRTPEQAQAFLDDLGNPYAAVVGDPNNRQSIEWGVYGLPETFVIDGDGMVVLHIRGPINQPIYEKQIKPALEAASAE